jgi:formylmethanofuran dehydrogenase subunit C
MRRGLLAVGGNCGDFPGINMIAGTVLVLGDCGIRPAPGMRRGTVGLLGPTAPPLLPTFRKGSALEQPLFLTLIFRELRRLDFAVPDEIARGSFRIHHGDFVAGGRGEIFTRNAA